MEFQGVYALPAAAAEVWRCMFEAAILKDTIPACESVRQVSDNEFEIRLKVSLLGFPVRFSGVMTVHDRVHPLSYRLEAQAMGRGLGRVGGTARVALVEQAAQGRTLLEYGAAARLEGRLASLAEVALRGAATNLSDRFFDRFAAAMRRHGAAIAEGEGRVASVRGEGHARPLPGGAEDPAAGAAAGTAMQVDKHRLP